MPNLRDIAHFLPPGLSGRRARRSDAALLLKGRPGTDGFVFHDGWNQPVHRAAPGVLGLLEARHVVDRWKPEIVRWMDERGHFFDHILNEYRGEPYSESIRREIEEIQAADSPGPDKSRFLFQYLKLLAGELERSDLPFSRRAAVRVTGGPRGAGAGRFDVSLDGIWTAYHRTGPGAYVEREVPVPVNWELLPGIENYAGSMRFTKVLHVPSRLQGGRLLLSFAGVDYFADVWVNGHYAGGHEGFFSPFELDVSPYIRFDEWNVVRVSVTSPNDPAGPGIGVSSGWHDFSPASSFPNRKTMVKGTLGHHDAKRGGAWSALTSQDGNTGGIWDSVTLRVRRPVHFEAPGTRVATLSVAPGEAGSFDATIRVTARVRNSSGRPLAARVRLEVSPSNFRGMTYHRSTPVVLGAGCTDVALEEELRDVAFWQPWDRGFPHLHTVVLRVEVDGEVQDESEVETGFRDLEVTPMGESPGPDGAFVVNGEPVYVRGTNLLPTYWLSEYTEERAERDFRMLRDAGFNAVLVHTLVGPRCLYECANRFGFMVVQMFPLQWSYEQSEHFVTRALHQVRAMAERLYNDPAVVSYEVHNEPDMRTAPDLDNREFDFELHRVLREADPHRWATTFSGGNHAYPGQFYDLRDDNSFETLPARFDEDEFRGRRISRHRNMPTEFGLQALPHVELFEALLAEDRVVGVLARMRTDPKWLAAGGESLDDALRRVAEASDVLGGGSWEGALRALDWTLLWDLGRLDERLAAAERAASAGDAGARRQVVSVRMAGLLLDVLHYGAFKGENFWHGLWRPAATLEQAVASSQARQYRLHKDAIEHYLNAGVAGPIVGYFSFMFRDADWQAPTWGVVDASWVPKKAYRAYVESNQPIRVTLPPVLRSPVKLPGDRWFASPPDASGGRACSEPHAIVANDTREPVLGAQVELSLATAAGATVPLSVGEDGPVERHRFTVDVDAGGGAVVERLVPGPGGDPSAWRLPEATAPGTYFLWARVCGPDGSHLAANTYEIVVPDTAFRELSGLGGDDVAALLVGGRDAAGFRFWSHRRELCAGPGVRGLLDGCHEADRVGISLYEVIQGEHLFRHILGELASVPAAAFLVDGIWQIRSEIVSPAEKSRVLLAYLERFVRRAEEQIAGVGAAGDLHRSAAADVRREATAATPTAPWHGGRPRPAPVPVGRDVPTTQRLFARRERRELASLLLALAAGKERRAS